ANFGSNFDYKFTRITALLGGVYYPVKTASLKNDFQFSVHGMVGATYLNTKYDNGSFSNSNSNINFTADVGVGINYKINNNWGLGLRAGYAPVFAKGYTANNIAVSVGVIFK
ncbi:MAG TPA: outer membrane beta-barrel protein, partial [Chitinophagaceae bacterium]|nr:outer membrane beta-barrel protein [Chitinophagaceae bacterium]